MFIFKSQPLKMRDFNKAVEVLDRILPFIPAHDNFTLKGVLSSSNLTDAEKREAANNADIMVTPIIV
jgi:pullulanase/glycogen debranching enzyme